MLNNNNTNDTKSQQERNKNPSGFLAIPRQVLYFSRSLGPEKDCFLYIYDRTIGYKKSYDYISLKDFRQFTQISNDRILLKHLKSLTKANLIIEEKGKGRRASRFWINVPFLIELGIDEWHAFKNEMEWNPPESGVSNENSDQQTGKENSHSTVQSTAQPENLYCTKYSTTDRSTVQSTVHSTVQSTAQVYSCNVLNKLGNKENNNRPANAGPDACGAVVVFSCLDELDISDDLKAKVSERFANREDAELLVQRVKRWEKRTSDSRAVNYILSKWEVWDDTKTPSESLQEALKAKLDMEEISKQCREWTEQRLREHPTIPVSVSTYNAFWEANGQRGIIGYGPTLKAYQDRLERLIAKWREESHKDVAYAN